MIINKFLISGYITNPTLSKEEYRLKRKILEDFFGLNTKIFHEGIKGGQEIGPSGILFSGVTTEDPNLILKTIYNKETPGNIKGLDFDLTISKKKENIEVKLMNLDYFVNSYFGLKVDFNFNFEQIQKFNQKFIFEEPNCGYRYNHEEEYIIYDYLTNTEEFNLKYQKAKENLLKNWLKIDEKGTIIIENLE